MLTGARGPCGCSISRIKEEIDSFVMFVLLGAALQGVLRGLQGGGGCICHLCLGLVSWCLTQISPLGQCQASSQGSTTADNRLVWQSIQTLEAKQP